MSSLIIYTDEQQAFVATDTLAMSGLNHTKPLMFTTKAFIVPHLRIILSGTGAGGFLGRWFIQVNDRMVVRDIDNLDYHTPQNLDTLWAAYKKEFSIPDTVTTSVYHFGFSCDGAIHSYEYHSGDGFTSNPLSHGVMFKPNCEIPGPYEFPGDIKAMMVDQRRIEQASTNRVYIGGEIIIHHLTKQGFNVYTLDRFDDFESTDKTIFASFASDSQK